MSREERPEEQLANKDSWKINKIFDYGLYIRTGFLKIYNRENVRTEKERTRFWFWLLIVAMLIGIISPLISYYFNAFR